MKYALIGCGRISINHIRAAIANNLEIVALCDVDEKKINSLIDNKEINLDRSIKKYFDYKRMIFENNLDLISIATESGKHAEIALFCIEHNLNLIIEKPMAMNIKDANEIIEKSNLKKLKVSVCHQNRFNIAIQNTRQAIDQNRFGKLSHGCINIRWNRNENYYNQSKWRGTWVQDGGALMNQCIHGIDLLRWMMGDEVDEVYGVIRQQFHNYLEVEDVGLAVIKFKNGAIGTIEGTTNIFPSNLEETLSIFGEKGTVKIGGKSANNIETWLFDEKKDSDIEKIGLNEITSNVYGNGHIKLFEDVIASIINDRNPYVDAVAGKNALEVVLAIYLSQKINKPVKFPLKKFDTKDMIGFFREE